MGNIFKDYYFGKPYMTRCGERALLLQVNNCAQLAVKFGSTATTNYYKLDGTHLPVVKI